MRYLPVEDKPVSRPEVTQLSRPIGFLLQNVQAKNGSREMMWIWISPEQRHHAPPNTAGISGAKSN